jgi:hypothetical protein
MTAYDFAARRKASLSIRDFRVDRFILCPDHWRNYNPPAPLTWHRIKFDDAQAALVPNNERGVYTFVAEPNVASHPSCNYLLYVGKVEDSNFRIRFKSYLSESEKKKPREHVLYRIDRWKPCLWFYYSALPRSVRAETIEDMLIAAFLPPVNRLWPATIRDTMKLVFS